jgi:hypothetical protein
MSVQPLTVTTALERTAAQHQSLLYFWLKRPGSIWRPDPRAQASVAVDHQRGAVLRRVELNQSARLSGRRGFAE